MEKKRREKERKAEAGQRLFDAYQMWSRASGATLIEVQEELGISRSTALRYLEALAQRDLPTETIGMRGLAKIHRVAQKQVTFSLEEAFWQKVMERFASGYRGTGIDEAFARVSSKIEATLRPRDRAKIAELDKKILDLQEQVHDYEGKADVVDELLTALLEQRPVMITQRSRGKDARKMRVDPYTLVTYKRALYVVAWSHHHSAMRTFAIDAIDDAERVKNERFDVPVDYDPKQRFEGAFGMIRGEKTDVTIRFDPSVEPWLQKRRVHPTQQIEKRGKWVYLRMKPHGTTELLTWVLGWGSKATVIAPASLRDEWKREVEAMMKAAKESVKADGE